MSKAKTRIIIPPTAFIGEMIPWRGYWWKVQAFSSTGGDIALKDEAGNLRGVFANPTCVLEAVKPLKGKSKT